MNRTEKEAVIQLLHDSLLKNQSSFLVNYQGLSVNQMQSLRAGLREKGANLRVAKARLMKRAVDGVEGADQLMPFLKDQIAMVFSQEAPSAAKVLYDFSKKNENLELVVGLFESNLYDAQALGRIASLPPREILLAQVCGTLKAPITKTVGLLNMLIVRLLLVLKQIEEKKQ